MRSSTVDTMPGAGTGDLTSRASEYVMNGGCRHNECDSGYRVASRQQRLDMTAQWSVGGSSGRQPVDCIDLLACPQLMHWRQSGSYP